MDSCWSKSALVQVMAWWCQATSHYLGQCWLSPIWVYGVSRPQCVNHAHGVCFVVFLVVKYRLILPIFFRVAHDDVIRWKCYPRYWPFVLGIHRPPVNSLHKGQRHRALMFSLICAWINGWVNNGEAGDLRHHCAHYDVIVLHTSTGDFSSASEATLRNMGV